MIYVDRPSILASLNGTELVELNVVDPIGDTFTGAKLYASVDLISSGAQGRPSGTNGQIQYNNSGSFGGFTVSGDGTLNAATGTITITKTNGFPFAPSATINTTDAGNISVGTLNALRLPGFGGDVSGGPGSSSLTVSKVNGAALGATTPTSGNILVGSGTQWVTQGVSGDIALNASGGVTISFNAVSNTKFRQSAALSVVGNSGISTANVADITGTANQVLLVNGAGTVLGFGAIDLSQSAAVSNQLGVANGGTGKTSLTAFLDTLGSSQGDILYRDAGGWAALAPGTLGNVLTANGPAANPTWSASGSGTSVPSGAVFGFAMNVVPSGYLQCNGAAISRSTFSALFAALVLSSTVTITIASPGVVTWTAHGFSANDPVKFKTTGALPTGITAGTTYFVVGSSITTNTFRISTTAGGVAINTSGSQSGTQTGIHAPFGDGDGSTTFNVPDLRGEFVRGWDSGAGVDTNRSFGSSQADAFATHTHTVTAVGSGANSPGSPCGGIATSPSSLTTGATGGTETRPKNIAMMYCIKT